MCPSPGTMLSTRAKIGLNPGLRRSRGNLVSGAPHDLQKVASATTIGWPHRAQNLGVSKSVSGTEGKRRVAEPDGITVAHWGADGHAPIVDEGAVLAVEILDHERAVVGLDARVMARD